MAFFLKVKYKVKLNGSTANRPLRGVVYPYR